MNSLWLLKQKSFYLVFIIFVCLVGCKEQIAPAPETVRVSYLVAKSNDVPLITEMPGRVSAFLVSDVRPQVSGIIQKRLFEEGTDVKEGQQLYQIDPAIFQATYNSAKADLERAQANAISARLLAERYSKVVDIHAVSKQEYDNAIAARDQANAAVNAAKQAVETARINLEYTKVLSPVSGRISRSFVTPGALVTQNQVAPLATVQQLSPVYVDVTQSSADLLKLRRAFAAGEIQQTVNKGAKIKLKLEDGSPYVRVVKPQSDEETMNPQPIFGELQFSDVTVEQTTGVVTLRATFDNPDNILLPGMYVRAVIEEGVRAGSILLPQKVVQHDTKNRPTVFVLTKTNPNEGESDDLDSDEYYVALRYVTIDRDYENQWLVTDGLHVGERVIVDGFQKIRHGQVVVAERLDQKNLETLSPALRQVSPKVSEEKAPLVDDESSPKEGLASSEKENGAPTPKESVKDKPLAEPKKEDVKKENAKKSEPKKPLNEGPQKTEESKNVSKEASLEQTDTPLKENKDKAIKKEVKKEEKPQNEALPPKAEKTTKPKIKIIPTPVSPREVISEKDVAKAE